MKQFTIYLYDNTEKSIYATTLKEALKLLKISAQDMKDFDEDVLVAQELQTA